MTAQAPTTPTPKKTPVKRGPRPMGALLTPVQVARVLGIHRATLYRWLERGEFPPPMMKNGRIVRWSRELVEQFARGGLPA